ncbi:MAG: tRNA (adenosine(37)-N6)-dimethylallyltransferase MiaA [Anaerolineales bacterium]
MIQITKPLIVIVGPTAVGKTELSVRLTKKLDGEIVSADSRLFYKGMDIGTAKPTQVEMDGVPHHLINIAEPDDEWSLARYLPRAQDIINDILARGNIPFLVGGTGQYVQAVVEGWDLPGIEPDPLLRQILSEWAAEIGTNGIRSRLEILDPDAAANIDGPNLRRMVRALEVILSSGKKFSSQKNKKGSMFRILQIGLIRPREELYQRIDIRIDRMIEEGLIQEVQTLLEAGHSRELSSMSAIGYKQIAAHLSGEISIDEAIRQIRSKTRKYVRQQANWFKQNDENIKWFSAADDPYKEILNEIQHFL